MIGVFDLESDNLLDEVTKIHCIALRDLEKGTTVAYRSDDEINSISAGLKAIASCKKLVGQNILAYDLPVIKKLYPDFHTDAVIRDTLIMSKIVFADVKESDMKMFKKGRMPGNLIGRYSLKAWGYRLGILKGEFGESNNWEKITNEMVDYCIQDVEVTTALYNRIMKEGCLDEVVDMEQELHLICTKQTADGINFNMHKAQELEGKLLVRKQTIQRDLKERFTSGWFVDLGIKTPTRNVTYKDVLRGSEVIGGSYHKVKWIDFNPNSRSHLGKVLVDFCKWKPTEFGKDGVATINEETLKTVGDKEVVKLLEEYLTLEKRLGQLATGAQGWMSVAKDGKIHHRIDTLGAVTGRATHSSPNLAQIPSNNSPWGTECRALFEPKEGWKLFGSDCSGLELRMLGHYMSHWDNGAYGDIILSGDVHTSNQLAAGLQTRNQAKVFIYSFLYGAGSKKIGETINGTEEDGKRLKAKFLNNLPALKNLGNAVSAKAEAGFIKALDSRHVIVRHKHAALNTLLQSAGNLVTKYWIIYFQRILKERGYVLGVDFINHMWIHDEIVMSYSPKLTHEILAEISKTAIDMAQVKLKIRMPLDISAASGLNYSEIH